MFINFAKMGLIALSIFLYTHSSYAKQESSMVLVFLDVVTSDQEALLTDKIFFSDSDGDDTEYLSQLIFCKSQGWNIKPAPDKKCQDFINTQWKEARYTSSKYYKWLKQKLENPLIKFQVKSKRTVRKTPDDPEAYIEIAGKYNDKFDLVFKLPIFDPQGPYFGRIRLVKINGKSVEEMLRQELEAQKVSK